MRTTSMGLLVVGLTAACGSKTENLATSASAKAAAVTSSKAVASASASASPKLAPPKKGPLPVGFSLAVQAQKTGDELVQTGGDVSLVMSATDDPMLAYLEGVTDGLKIRFTAWDRDAGKWKGPVTVDVAADLPRFAHTIAIARDKSSSALGIAYRKSEKEVWLALSSDSGTTWKTEKVATATGTLAGASIALAKGGQFIAFNDGDDVKVLSRFAATGDFKAETAPLLPDTGAGKGTDVSIRVDSDGKPGLLYGLNPKAAYNTTVAFWRPGDVAPSKVTDSNNIQDDALHVSLAFAGTKPRAAISITRGGGEKSSTYFVTSDDGKTWAPPINVLPDGGQSMDGFLDLAVTENSLPRPEVEAIAMPVTGGNTDGTKCGDPKVARMNDMKSFATCSPDADRALGFDVAFAAAAFDEKGKLYIAFANKAPEAKLPAGLMVWHD